MTSGYKGDIKAGKILYFPFDTQVNGLPITSSSATVKVYKNGSSTTEVTTGVTTALDFDSLTGMALVTIDTSSDGSFYAAGNDYDVALTALTVSGNTIRIWLGSFSIENRCVNWAQVASPTTTLNLSGTTIGIVTALASGAIAAAAFAANALDAVWSTATRALTDKVGFALSTAGVQAIWDALTSALTTVGSVGKRIADFLTGDSYVRLGAPAGASHAADVAAVKGDTGTILTDVNTGAGAIYTRLGAPAGASHAADIAAVKTDTAAIKPKTDNLPGSPAAVGSAMTLTSGERTSVADALLDRDMSVGTDSGSTTVRTVRQALRFLRNLWAISGGTLTVNKEDDTTPSWTAAVTTSAGDPVSKIDPA